MMTTHSGKESGVIIMLWSSHSLFYDLAREVKREFARKGKVSA